MEHITEDFILYIWKFKLFQLEDAEGIEILNTGIRNLDAGPDFFNAHIKIHQALWVGNVEMHVHGEDWYKHQHHLDTAYNNVILHVIWDKPVKILNQHGREIPTLVLKKRVFAEVLTQFKALDVSVLNIPCGPHLAVLPDTIWHATLEKNKIARLQQRAQELLELHELHKGDWEQTLYLTLARSFGFKVNALPFMMMARSISLALVRKHRHLLHELESLFLGVSGLLEIAPNDAYTTELQATYRWLQRKYHLQTLGAGIWKFSKMRPTNFPSLRIAQFCAFLHQNEHLFSRFLHRSEAQDWTDLFSSQPSEYWQSHYRLGVEAAKVPYRMGKDAADTLLLNTVVPFLFVYGQFKNKPELVQYALSLLHHLPPENNRTTRIWNAFGKKPANAGESQAMMELYQQNCQHKRCMDCQIGHYFMKQQHQNRTTLRE